MYTYFFSSDKSLLAGESIPLEVLASIWLAADLVSGVLSHVGQMHQDTSAYNMDVGPDTKCFGTSLDVLQILHCKPSIYSDAIE